jgi:5'-3' exonuclease
VKTWLILDSNYLAYRAFYSTGRYENGALYGFLLATVQMIEQFHPDATIFCFDGSGSVRKSVYPEYKAHRKQKSSEIQQQPFVEFKKTLKALCKEYLPQLGFSNVFSQAGYEADDIIASVILNRPNSIDTKCIIGSPDRDMFQLLTPYVSMYLPRHKVLYTYQDFKEEFEIEPCMWNMVLALSGCRTDGVKGIRGIGLRWALRFCQGKIKERIKVHKTNSIFYKRIMKGTSIFKRNLPLVTLPYPGVKEFKIRDDHVSRHAWRSLCRKFGFHKGQLYNRIPVSRSTIRHGIPNAKGG